LWLKETGILEGWEGGGGEYSLIFTFQREEDGEYAEGNGNGANERAVRNIRKRSRRRKEEVKSWCKEREGSRGNAGPRHMARYVRGAGREGAKRGESSITKKGWENAGEKGLFLIPRVTGKEFAKELRRYKTRKTQRSLTQLEE